MNASNDIVDLWRSDHDVARVLHVNRILSKDQILVSCSHMTCYLQKIHYYLLFISKHFQLSRNDVNPTSTSEVTSKTIFYYFI